MKSSKSCSAWFGESFIFAVQDISQLNSDIVDTEVSNDILMNLQNQLYSAARNKPMQIKTMIMIKLHFKKKHALTLDIYSRCSCFNWKSRNFAGIKLRWTLFFIDNLPVRNLSSSRLIKVIVSGTPIWKNKTASAAHFRFFWLTVNDRGTMRWANWSYFLDEWNCGQVWNIKPSKVADAFPPFLRALWYTVETLQLMIEGSIWFMMIHFPPWFLIAFGSTFRSFQVFLPFSVASWAKSDSWTQTIWFLTYCPIACSWLLIIVLTTISWHILHLFQVI